MVSVSCAIERRPNLGDAAIACCVGSTIRRSRTFHGKSGGSRAQSPLQQGSADSQLPCNGRICKSLIGGLFKSNRQKLHDSNDHAKRGKKPAGTGGRKEHDLQRVPCPHPRERISRKATKVPPIERDGISLLIIRLREPMGKSGFAGDPSRTTPPSDSTVPGARRRTGTRPSLPRRRRPQGVSIRVVHTPRISRNTGRVQLY